MIKHEDDRKNSDLAHCSDHRCIHLDLYWPDLLFLPDLWIRKFSSDPVGRHSSGYLLLAKWIDPTFPRIPRKPHGVTDVCCKTSQRFAVHHRHNQSTVTQKERSATAGRSLFLWR